LLSAASSSLSYFSAIKAYQNALRIQPTYKKAAENLRQAEIKLQEETAGKWSSGVLILPVQVIEITLSFFIFTPFLAFY